MSHGAYSPSRSPGGPASPAPYVSPVVSPCPHRPACPSPGPCLPDSLRGQQSATPSAGPVAYAGDPGGGSGRSGVEVAVGHITSFAGTVSGSAEGVRFMKDAAPRFQGWNLAPLAGVPIVGLAFVNRLNVVADTWSDAAGILGDVLSGDSEKLVRAAANYIAAERAGAANIQKTPA